MTHISIHAINHTKSTNNYTPTQSEHCVNTGCFPVLYHGVKCKKLYFTCVSMSRKHINKFKEKRIQLVVAFNKPRLFCHNAVPITSPHSKSYLTPFFSVTTQKKSELEAQWILSEKYYDSLKGF